LFAGLSSRPAQVTTDKIDYPLWGAHKNSSPRPAALGVALSKDFSRCLVG